MFFQLIISVFRASVIMVMSGAEFFAIAIRATLWVRGQLDSLQQDMCIKNILFLSAFYSAYDMYQNTITREWYEILTSTHFIPMYDYFCLFYLIGIRVSLVSVCGIRLATPSSSIVDTASSPRIS
jgi:hypothetical protein